MASMDMSLIPCMPGTILPLSWDAYKCVLCDSGVIMFFRKDPAQSQTERRRNADPGIKTSPDRILCDPRRSLYCVLAHSINCSGSRPGGPPLRLPPCSRVLVLMLLPFVYIVRFSENEQHTSRWLRTGAGMPHSK